MVSNQPIPEARDLISILEREIVEGWSIDGYDLWHHGEHVDGDPTWMISFGGAALLVYYELGWYTQEGESRDVGGLLALMRGMMEASSVIDKHLKRYHEENKR